MSTTIKVGTVVMTTGDDISAPGLFGEVISLDTSDIFGLTHQVRFREPRLFFVGLAGRKRLSKECWFNRKNLIPIAPPGEPETLIESTPVRDEVTA